jgi:SAM-dependent methyltransferase
LIHSAIEMAVIQLSSASLSRQKQEWDELGTVDPLWAILADDQKKFGRWNLNEFFQTGSQEVEAVLARARSLGRPTQYSRALDFGCGVGRLSRAISRSFQVCVGVDISPAMVAMAKQLNPACEFYVLTEPNLNTFEHEYFDFIYSNIVLQHQPAESLVFAYISEFLRVLRPGGILVFQLPHYIPLRYRLEPRRRAYRFCRQFFRLPSAFLYRTLKLNPITMRAISEEKVTETISGMGGEVLAVQHDKNGGPHIESRTYFVSPSPYCRLGGTVAGSRS